MDTLNNELFPTEDIIRKTEEDILQNVKHSGVGALFGMAKPEDFIPSIMQFFQKRLTDEVDKRKKTREDEDKEKNNKLENERKALSDRRIALENQYQTANKEEINTMKNSFETQKRELLSEIEKVKFELNAEKKKNSDLQAKLFMNNEEYFRGEIDRLSNENTLLKNEKSELKNKLVELNNKINDPQHIKELHEKNEMARQQRLSANKMFRP